MAEVVYLVSLMTVAAFVLPPHCVFHQPALGVINKDCIQAECLSSSRKIQEHVTNSPPSNTVSNSYLPIGPVHE